jgi:hypothetical protein
MKQISSSKLFDDLLLSLNLTVKIIQKDMKTTVSEN